MALITTLAACSTNEALNGPAGTDLPSTLDDQIRYALRFIAELRDGQAIPAGQVAPFIATTAPAGWLKLNGALYSRTTYSRLWAFIVASGAVTTEAIWSGGYSGLFSNGDGTTNFRLPDYRGCFVRGLDEGRGLDVSRPLGFFQDHANVTHDHALYDPGHAHAVYDPGHVHSGATDSQGIHTHGYVATNVTTSAFTGDVSGNPVYGLTAGTTDPAGAHAHNLLVNAAATGIATYAAATGQLVAAAGGVDGHPRNMSTPYYIKY